jgi:hypothetical protein
VQRPAQRASPALGIQRSRRSRRLGIDRNHGVQLRIARCDPRQEVRRERLGRELPRLHRRLQLEDRSAGDQGFEVGADLVRSRSGRATRRAIGMRPFPGTRSQRAGQECEDQKPGRGR